MPSAVFSQTTEVRLQRNIPREDRAGGRRGGNGNFSGKYPVLGLGLHLLFLLKCPNENLQAFGFLLLVFLPRHLIILFFPISYYKSEDQPFRLFPCVPEPLLHCLHPHFLWSMMNSQRESATFNCWNYFFVRDQLGESLLFSQWDVVWCWDFRDVAKCSDDLAPGCNIDI